MRTLRSKYLSDIPIQEDNYKVDFIILEKYQGFSSELLRLSLVCLAIYGFLITNVIFKNTDSQGENTLLPIFLKSEVLFMFGAIVLIFAALFALGHRYFSTDCMTHFIRGFRLRKRLAELKEKQIEIDLAEVNKIEQSKIEQSIKSEEVSFESDLNKCKWLLIASGLFLILGITLIVIGLACSITKIPTA